jgi:hypothetical protein
LRFLLRVQDAEILLLQDSVARYERSLRLTRNQYAVGVVSAATWCNRPAQLESPRRSAAVARAQLEHAIAVLIGSASRFSVAALPLNVSIPAVAALRRLERRPDIAAAGAGWRRPTRRSASQGGNLVVNLSPAAAAIATPAAPPSTGCCSTAGCERRSAPATAA